MSTATVSDQEKEAVWKAYRSGRPTRVPVTLSTNPRVALLDPAWNPEGHTFEQAANDPRIHVMVSLQHQLWRRRVAGPCCDSPTELPETWTADMHAYNTYEAAYFGAEIDYSADQVPDTLPPFADDDRKHDVFDVDIKRPLENPFLRHWLDFWKEMETICNDLQFERRPVKLAPWGPCGSDGPVTVACNLRGAEQFMMDLVTDPEYADRLLAYITRAAILRREAFDEYWGGRVGGGNGLADDSCVLISNDMYIERVMPHHRAFYEAKPDAPRGMHMCGDATRLFPIIRRELNVTSFDTGFPVDFACVRRELGDDVEIAGGPQVALLMQGTPDAVSQRTVGILTSGIMQGGRFILREGNNLPPNTPPENLAAMYRACLDHGRYRQA